jgi:hypothetical protein
VLVVPPWRRRGLGTRLLEHLAAQARAAGRARLFLDVGEPLDGPGPGAALLRSAGARVGMVKTRRRLVLPPRAPQTAHRRHRLGLWIKLANLELLGREHPEVQAIDTFNADDNRWMIASTRRWGSCRCCASATGSWT